MTITEFILARAGGPTCGDAHPTMDIYHPDGHPNERDERTLRALAAIWSDHPDYQEAWKP